MTTFETREQVAKDMLLEAGYDLEVVESMLAAGRGYTELLKADLERMESDRDEAVAAQEVTELQREGLEEERDQLLEEAKETERLLCLAEETLDLVASSANTCSTYSRCDHLACEANRAMEEIHRRQNR